MNYDALTKSDVPLFASGNFVIFVMVKQINGMKKQAPPATAPATLDAQEDLLLLRQIRDTLAK